MNTCTTEPKGMNWHEPEVVHSHTRRWLTQWRTGVNEEMSTVENFAHSSIDIQTRTKITERTQNSKARV